VTAASGRRTLAELLGTALLVMAIIGSGIAATRLSPGQTGLQLLEKQSGEELGLIVTQVVGIGWSSTALADGTAAMYATELVQLARAITAYRYAEGAVPTSGNGDRGGKDGNGGSRGGGKGAPKNGVALVCYCPRRIRASTAVATLGPILCGVCGAEFTSAAL